MSVRMSITGVLIAHQGVEISNAGRTGVVVLAGNVLHQVSAFQVVIVPVYLIVMVNSAGLMGVGVSADSALMARSV